MAIGGRPAGTNFAAGLNPANGGVLDIPLSTSVDLVTSQAVLTVKIRDNAGQITEVTRAFAGESSTPPPPPPSALVPVLSITPAGLRSPLLPRRRVGSALPAGVAHVPARTPV